MEILKPPQMRSSATDSTLFSAKRGSSSSSTSSSTIVTEQKRVATEFAKRPASSTTASISRSIKVNASVASKKRKKGVDDGDYQPASALRKEVKRLRSIPTGKIVLPPSSPSSSKPPSRHSSRQPSPEPIYRSSTRSRSSSAFPILTTHVQLLQRDWVYDNSISDDSPPISAENVVLSLMKSYKAYFKNLDDPEDRQFDPHETNYPVAELEYPQPGACERFILLAPKDKDHYNPIMCLESSLYEIIEHYLTPKQQSLFGPIPNSILSHVHTPPPSPSPPSSTTSTPSSQCSLSSLSSLDDDSDEEESPLKVLYNKPKPNLLRSLQRAIHIRDGILFMKSITVINSYLRFLKYPHPPKDPFHSTPTKPFHEAVKGFKATGLPKTVLMRILEENYQRSVGPNVPKLRQYEAFSSTVYGELMPSLAYDIICTTGLKEDSLFLDLGSGVANVVVQASLQTGCRSFGVEIMDTVADVAQKSVENFRKRCRMWGLRVGEMEVEKNDMIKSKRVDELIPQADVILVDNKVFEESLNEALRPKFLDLKEGAIVVSLQPFVSSINARVTERNVDDMSAIFDVTERHYHSGSVSWGNGGGSYYIHRVDREGYAKIRERFEHSRMNGGNSGTRSTRSRR